MDKLVALALVAQVLTEGITRVGIKKYTVFVALVVGLVTSWLADIGLLEALGLTARNHYVDVVLAGIVIAGGAALVQALKQGLTKPPAS